MGPYIRRLTSLEDPDIDTATSLLHDVFVSEPVDFAFNGYDNALAEPGWRSTLLGALMPNSGEVWVASVEEAGVDAVCVAYGPGRWYSKTEEERKVRDKMFNNQLSEKANKWFEESYLANLNILYKRCLGDNFEERDRSGWHVSVLATRADKQGQGLGSALIRKIHEQADRDGVETILLAMKIENIAFYEHLGFVNGGEPVTIPFEGGESGLWCLTRPYKSPPPSS